MYHNIGVRLVRYKTEVEVETVKRLAVFKSIKGELGIRISEKTYFLWGTHKVGEKESAEQ